MYPDLKRQTEFRLHRKNMITRENIIETARKYIGYAYLHQGRGENKAVDCVGLPVCIAKELGYEVIDAVNYRRVPSATQIREILKMNCDEIKVPDAKRGDIFLMRLGGLKPRHTAIYFDEQDRMLLHASANGVRLEPLSNFPPEWFVSAFRLRGVI